MKSFNLKEVGLGILNLILAILFGYFGREVFNLKEGSEFYYVFSFPILVILIWSLAFCIMALVVSDRRVLWGSAFLSILSLYFFARTFVSIQIGVILIAFWLFLLAIRRIKKETANSVFFSAPRSLRSGLPLFFTALAIVSSVFYFSSLAPNDFSALLPRPLFNLGLNVFQKQFNEVLPGFDADLAVDGVLVKVLERQSPKGLAGVSKAEVNTFIQNQKESLSLELGMDLKGSEKAGDVLYVWANNKIRDWLNPWKAFIPLVLTVSFFILVKTLTWPLYWLSVGVVLGVVKVLVRYNFLKIVKETVEVEHLAL